jgi:beta-galactosidase
MNKIFAAVFLATLALNLFAAQEQSARITENFDSNWLFLKADATNADQVQFDDSGWRKLNVPHDWSIEGPFSETNKTGGAGAFLPSGVGWYRKHFTLPENFSNRCAFIEFDGVMANSDVWINGFHLGHRPYGYVSFSYELTGHLNFGGDNVIAVRTDTSEQPASRWYAGAGIYRHVRLAETGLVHVEPNGIFISTPEISADKAQVKIQMQITNEDANADGWNTDFAVSIFAPDGKLVATQERGEDIGALAEDNRMQTLEVAAPKLWSLESPALYTAVTEIWIGGEMSDRVETKFGIREFHFDADTGFWLNGKNFKIYGVALHADGGAFGAAVPLSIWESRLKTLKSVGVNAIRTAHNPPAPEFLDLCDRMGFLVMDEMFDCWTVAKNPYDYHLYFNDWSLIDTADTVRRDRNHPSVILYSAGNEIHDTPNAELSKKILAGLVQVFHTNDPTRPVTQALFRPNVSHDYDDGLADLLDVVGTNYRDNELLAAQRNHPSWKIIGTEQRHDRQTWLWLRDNPSEAGQFLWSGIDYLGEARRWPIIGAGSGLLDRTGAPKPMAFERQSWWSDRPMVFIARRIGMATNSPTDPGFAPLERRQVLFADWTPRNLQPHDENVEIYSNCKTVELFLNGKSLGAKEINADASPRNWNVPFAPGILKAVARNENGKVVATDELQTAGKPAKIILSADKREIADDWNDVCEVTAKITDKNGIIVPSADNLVSFKISGAGEIAAVDNADNSSHESFQASERHAFHGECVAFVKANFDFGKIKLMATAAGLKSGSMTIKIAKPSSPASSPE